MLYLYWIKEYYMAFSSNLVKEWYKDKEWINWEVRRQFSCGLSCQFPCPHSEAPANLSSQDVL